MKDFGFYLVITNPVVGYARCAEAAVRAGVKIVQLRMKHAAREDILREAREMRRVTQGTETLFIVNDDPALAAEAEADGVHVGQDDMPPAEVRAKFPQLKVVGLSTHNLDQVRASWDQPIDYRSGVRHAHEGHPRPHAGARDGGADDRRRARPGRCDRRHQRRDASPRARGGRAQLRGGARRVPVARPLFGHPQAR